jgi:hypothetical protein
VQPIASIANAATSAAATVRTASVVLLLFVLIGRAFHGPVHKRGSATVSLADEMFFIALAGSLNFIGRSRR